MIKYTVKRNGIIISEYTSDFADENYYEENWGPKQQVIQHPEIPATEETPKIDAYEEIIQGYIMSTETISPPVADISPRQIRLALLSLGTTEAMVDAAIAGLESPVKEQAMIAWKYSTTFVRRVPIIEAIGTLLGLSSDQLDQIWALAGGL